MDLCAGTLMHGSEALTNSLNAAIVEFSAILPALDYGSLGHFFVQPRCKPRPSVSAALRPTRLA